jgi:hypothetical protein
VRKRTSAEASLTKRGGGKTARRRSGEKKEEGESAAALEWAKGGELADDPIEEEDNDNETLNNANEQNSEAPLRGGRRGDVFDSMD